MPTSRFSKQAVKKLPVTASQLGTGLVAGAGGLYGLLRELSKPKRPRPEDEILEFPMKTAEGPLPDLPADPFAAPANFPRTPRPTSAGPLPDLPADPFSAPANFPRPPRSRSANPAPSVPGPMTPVSPAKSFPAAPALPEGEVDWNPPGGSDGSGSAGWGDWLTDQANGLADAANNHPWLTAGALGLGGLGGYGLYRAMSDPEEDEDDDRPVKMAGLLGSMFAAARRSGSRDSLLKAADGPIWDRIAADVRDRLEAGQIDRAYSQAGEASGRLAGLGAAAAPTLGWLRSPKGHGAEGAVRGGVYGVGGLLGAVLGSGIGSRLGENHPSEDSASGVATSRLGGAVLGAAGGGLTGLLGSRLAMGPASWTLEDDEEDGDDQPK